MTLQELQTQHERALTTAESIISSAERQRRTLNPHEQQIVDNNLREAGDLKQKIAAAKAKDSPIRTVAEMRASLAKFLGRNPVTPVSGDGQTPDCARELSREYLSAAQVWLSRTAHPPPCTKGPAQRAAMPFHRADDQIVPPAPSDSAVRRLATVIPTRSDIKTPQVTARGL